VADDTDLAWLERAAELGRRGWGRVHPNPMVGCVLVRDDGVVAEAWHREFGGPHAEALALAAAGAEARGSTAYVSLEPCRHQGKTPACTAALVRNGVERVVFGAPDPTAEAGGGAAELRQAGLDVEGPLFDPARARRENPAFFHTALHPTPFVALKLAVSMDGRIAQAPGRRTRITGALASREVHRLRAGFDAVLVGAGTARVDDPLLTVREPVPMSTPPTRIVLDSDARLPTTARIFRDVEAVPLVVFVATDAPEDRLERLEEAGARVHPVDRHPDGGLDTRAVLRVSRQIGVRSILCEGGAELASTLLALDQVQRMILFIAPRLLGPGAVAAAVARPPARSWILAGEPQAFGDDVRIVWDRRGEETAPGLPASETRTPT
jgi:diaminohydroxyphosphoribosylaminopyrimidine deaminase/5-amino-6-(5-phosphoribosylamino)uracil reductase